MTALIPPDGSDHPPSPWVVRHGGAARTARDRLAENAEGERVVGAARRSAVVTPVGGADELVTTLDATLGVVAVTSGTFGRVVGYAREGEQRLDVHLLFPDRTTFSLAHKAVRVDAAAVAFDGDRVVVRTALVTAERRHTGVHVRLPGSDAESVHDLASGEVRASTASGHRVTSRVEADSASLAVSDDVMVRVMGDDAVQALLAGGHTTLQLEAGARHVELTCADGTASISTAAGAVMIACSRSGRRVKVDRDELTVQSADASAGVRWDRGTSTLSDGGDVPLDGLHLRWSDRGLEFDLGDGFTVVVADRVRISWCGKTFSVGQEDVIIADEEENWYVAADGSLGTGACMVTTGPTIDGSTEVFVRSVDHGWSASMWSHGTFVDDGAGLRTVLDEHGAVFTPASRTDSAVVSQRDERRLVVNAATARVEIGHSGGVLLKSGLAELRVLPTSDGRALRSTIACGDLFSVVVTDCERDGLVWRTTHRSSSVSHLVRGAGELVVRNSPSGSVITATVDEVRVVPFGASTEHVITV
ncbi:hypothetical protein [Umezawaea tangerina]|uniref:Uncharacterized protein n=1 Tax=Umezawaea tangerina TaxID=84725 RepID=A0A2T0SZX5_9PSEU|nr:hypothetical protein [Umezawaea tangerina]PRY38978.1 hypothetical protein CLV43_108378 [Umezawaea tangerina]